MHQASGSPPPPSSLGMVFVRKISGAILPNATMRLYLRCRILSFGTGITGSLSDVLEQLKKLIIVIVNFTIFYLTIWRFVYMECGAQVISLELPGSKIQSRCLSLHTLSLFWLHAQIEIVCFLIICRLSIENARVTEREKVPSNKRCIKQ